jgi:hypothetical protein
MLRRYGLRSHWGQQLEQVRHFSFHRYLQTEAKFARANVFGQLSSSVLHPPGGRRSLMCRLLCISPSLPFNALECCSRA